MQFAFHHSWVLAHFNAHIAQHGAPNPGAENGEQGKQSVIHAHDARRDADEMADNREQARNENAHRAVMFGPALGAFDFFRRDKKLELGWWQ